MSLLIQYNKGQAYNVCQITLQPLPSKHLPDAPQDRATETPKTESEAGRVSPAPKELQTARAEAVHQTDPDKEDRHLLLTGQ